LSHRLVVSCFFLLGKEQFHSVVTVEADDDFVTAFDTKPKLFVVNKEPAGTAGDLERLSERIRKDLFEIYPQLKGKSTIVKSAHPSRED
jgi:hypothetical protein